MSAYLVIVEDDRSIPASTLARAAAAARPAVDAGRTVFVHDRVNHALVQLYVDGDGTRRWRPVDLLSDGAELGVALTTIMRRID